jgi:hypothetical protein
VRKGGDEKKHMANEVSVGQQGVSDVLTLQIRPKPGRPGDGKPRALRKERVAGLPEEMSGNFFKKGITEE